MQMEMFSFTIIAVQLQNLEEFSSVYFMTEPKFIFFVFLT